MTTTEIRNLVETELDVDISNKRRERNLVYARAIYFKICRDRTYLSLQEIGDTLDLNHATVLHAVKNIFPSFKLYNPEYLSLYKKIISTDEYVPMESRYEVLKQDYSLLQTKYEKLKEIGIETKYKSLVSIIKEIPEEQLMIANVRIDAMVKMLKAY